jgi:hypothetical protein
MPSDLPILPERAPEPLALEERVGWRSEEML